jgi:membrane protein YdbS with pleckstrin-like domain
MDYGNNMSLLTRLMVIVTIVVSVTDAIVFYKVKQHPERITVKFVILVILVTVIPIFINLWYHSRQR